MLLLINVSLCGLIFFCCMMFSSERVSRFGRFWWSTITCVIANIQILLDVYILLVLYVFLCFCRSCARDCYRIIIILILYVIGWTHRGRRSMWLWIPKSWWHQQVRWLVFSCFDDLELIHLNIIWLSRCGAHRWRGATDRLRGNLGDVWSHILLLSRVVDWRYGQMWIWSWLHCSILTCLITMFKVSIDGAIELLLVIFILFSCRRLLLIFLLLDRSKSALCCQNRICCWRSCHILKLLLLIQNAQF